MKVRLAAVFVLLWTLSGAYAPARAQEGTEDGISLQVSIGLDGYYRYKDWVRVLVVAENTGAPVDEVLLTGSETYSLKFSLPPGARKSFEVYLRLDTAGSRAAFTLRDARDNRVLARVKTPSTLVGEDELLIGVWSARMETAALFAPPPGGRRTVRHAFLSAEDLPLRPQGYDMLNALVIGPDRDTARLSEEQRQALRQWVLNGGRLTILGGGAWTNARSLEEMLPLIPTGAAPAAGILLPDGAPPPEALMAVQGALRPDARLLSGTLQQPSVLERPYGHGRVLYSAFDPFTLPQERRQPVFDALWAWSGAQEAPAPVYRLNDLSSSSAYKVLHDLKQVLPPLGTIALLVLLYPVALGPLHYRLMRSRSQWMWGSTLLISILFSAVLIAWGKFRSQENVLNRWYAVQSWEGEPQARVDGLVGLYSSARGRRTYQVEDAWQVAPLLDAPYDGGSQPDFTVQYTSGGVTLPNARMGTASMAHLAVSGAMPAPGFQSALRSAALTDTLALTGTFTWNEEFPLSDVALMAPGGPYPLDDIAPGVNRLNIPLQADGQIDRQEDASVSLPAGGPPLPIGMANTYYIPSFSSTENDFLNAMRSEMPAPPAGRVLLMGWGESLHLPEAPWQEDGRILPAAGKVLYVFSLPLEEAVAWKPGSRFSLTTKWHPRPSYLCSEQADGCPASFLAQFALPVPPPSSSNIRASLTLTVSARSSAPIPRVDIWNPQSQAYEPLPAAATISLPQAETYLGPRGEILFRLSHPGGGAQDVYLGSLSARLDLEILP